MILYLEVQCVKKTFCVGVITQRERECQVLLSYDHDDHDEVFVERCSVARRNSLTMILTWCWWITIVTLVTLVTVSVVAEGSD